MSTHIYLQGIMPQSKQWHIMRQAYEACEEAGVTPPDKILNYFGFDEHSEENITDEGVIVDLEDCKSPAVEAHSEEMQDGYLVDLSKLDRRITHLRFVISY